MDIITLYIIARASSEGSYVIDHLDYAENVPFLIFESQLAVYLSHFRYDVMLYAAAIHNI